MFQEAFHDREVGGFWSFNDDINYNSRLAWRCLEQSITKQSAARTARTARTATSITSRRLYQASVQQHSHQETKPGQPDIEPNHVYSSKRRQCEFQGVWQDFGQAQGKLCSLLWMSRIQRYTYRNVYLHEYCKQWTSHAHYDVYTRLAKHGEI